MGLFGAGEDGWLGQGGAWAASGCLVWVGVIGWVWLGGAHGVGDPSITSIRHLPSTKTTLYHAPLQPLRDYGGSALDFSPLNDVRRLGAASRVVLLSGFYGPAAVCVLRKAV